MVQYSSHHKRFTILLVEDQADDFALVKHVFDSAGIDADLHRVENGRQCLDYLHGRGEYANAPEPDLVLLDLGLPEMSGVDILRAIRGDEHCRLIPVVALTTSTDVRDLRDCYRLRVNSFLRKPVDHAEFQQMISGLLNFWVNVATLPSGKSGEALGLH